MVEFDEPLAIDPLDHLLQELDAAVVVGQVVVGEDDGGEPGPRRLISRRS